MRLAQGPQRSDTGEARTRGPSVSSQALYHWATAPCSLKLSDTELQSPSVVYACWDNNICSSLSPIYGGKESRSRCPYTFYPYCLGHIKIRDSSIIHWLLHRWFLSYAEYPTCTCTSADVFRICGISHMYMYRAAVHSLDAEFTVLEMTTSNAFFLVSSRFCTISNMLLSCQRIGGILDYVLKY